ncbi:hypothetical protein [Methylomonas sp. AM2-LC]|uniref:hypothetical protein n=1 Tax=Methylomonas sp. AM2-LC TaxID=3153301 RepID=UPI003264941F
MFKTDIFAQREISFMYISTQLATFHLEELKNTNMISDYYAVGSPVCWGIIQGGRAYLVQRGLLT